MRYRIERLVRERSAALRRTISCRPSTPVTMALSRPSPPQARGEPSTSFNPDDRLAVLIIDKTDNEREMITRFKAKIIVGLLDSLAISSLIRRMAKSRGNAARE
jgi:hypothetical protein